MRSPRETARRVDPGGAQRNRSGRERGDEGHFGRLASAGEALRRREDVQTTGLLLGPERDLGDEPAELFV